MGAIVTIKVKPGTDIGALQNMLQSKLAKATGEPVQVIINKVETPQIDVNSSIKNPYLEPNTTKPLYT